MSLCYEANHHYWVLFWQLFCSDYRNKDLINHYYISQCNLWRLKHLILYCNRSLVDWIFKPAEKSTLPYTTVLQCSWEDTLPWQLHEAQVAWRETEANGNVFFTSKHLKFSLQVIIVRWWNYSNHPLQVQWKRTGFFGSHSEQAAGDMNCHSEKFRWCYSLRSVLDT